jgi:hypothetical protein
MASRILTMVSVGGYSPMKRFASHIRQSLCHSFCCRESNKMVRVPVVYSECDRKLVS